MNNKSWLHIEKKLKKRFSIIIGNYFHLDDLVFSWG